MHIGPPCLAITRLFFILCKGMPNSNEQPGQAHRLKLRVLDFDFEGAASQQCAGYNETKISKYGRENTWLTCHRC